MRYSKWEQRQLDQETGARLDYIAKHMPGQSPTTETAEEYLSRIESIIHEVNLILDCVDAATLDQWEMEQYNRLKLEQERNNADR